MLIIFHTLIRLTFLIWAFQLAFAFLVLFQFEEKYYETKEFETKMYTYQLFVAKVLKTTLASA